MQSCRLHAVSPSAVAGLTSSFGAASRQRLAHGGTMASTTNSAQGTSSNRSPIDHTRRVRHRQQVSPLLRRVLRLNRRGTRSASSSSKSPGRSAIRDGSCRLEDDRARKTSVTHSEKGSSYEGTHRRRATGFVGALRSVSGIRNRSLPAASATTEQVLPTAGPLYVDRLCVGLPQVTNTT